MENEAAGEGIYQSKEEIVQPLLTIQQYALMELQILRNKIVLMQKNKRSRSNGY